MKLAATTTERRYLDVRSAAAYLCMTEGAVYAGRQAS